MCAKKSASLTLTTAIHSLGSFLAGLCAVLNGSFSSQFGLTLSSTGDDFAPQFGLIFWVRTILSSICAFSVSILDFGMDGWLSFLFPLSLMFIFSILRL